MSKDTITCTECGVTRQAHVDNRTCSCNGTGNQSPVDKIQRFKFDYQKRIESLEAELERAGVKNAELEKEKLLELWKQPLETPNDKRRKKEVDKLKAELERVKGENAQLKARVGYLEKDRDCLMNLRLETTRNKD